MEVVSLGGGWEKKYGPALGGHGVWQAATVKMAGHAGRLGKRHRAGLEGIDVSFP
jgi:hypothetical protein